MRCNALLVLAACGSPSSSVVPQSPAWIAETAFDPKTGTPRDAPDPVEDVGDAPIDDTPGPQGPPVPGCTPDEAKLRRAELAAIDSQVRRPDVVPKDVLIALRATLSKPCLLHIAPLMHVPATTTVDLLRDGWDGMDYVLLQATVSLHEWRGKPQLIVPRDIAPDLTDAAKAELAWLMCPAKDASCDRVNAYLARAELAFDTRHDQKDAGNGVSEYDWGGSVRAVMKTRCDEAKPFDDDHEEIDTPATWESWATCIGSRATRNKRYAEKRFRALDRGWLVMRGRRGHYQAADEIRAYDLATGAAYVVQNQTGVIMTPDQVKLAQQGVQGFTGRVAPDHLREIMVLLAARKAIVEVRTATVYANIPPTLPRTLSTGTFFGTFGRVTWSSSDQTTIEYTYLDGATRKSGSFTWPNAADWLDDHVAELVRIMEAGLVKGCAPAKLPTATQLAGPPAKVSPIDEDEQRVRDYYAKLEARLETLRTSACPGAR
jgi:hypothetical protein